MKPKGWRLDPAWVEHYSKIEQERIEREVERAKMAYQMEQARDDLRRWRERLQATGRIECL